MECLINGYVPTELMINGKVISGCAKGGNVVYRKKNAIIATNYGDDIITTNDTVYAQIKNLNIYGKSTVEDDVISSVGDSRSIEVSSCGKNLVRLDLSASELFSSTNNSMSIEDGIITLNASVGSGYRGNYYTYNLHAYKPATKYTIIANILENTTEGGVELSYVSGVVVMKKYFSIVTDGAEIQKWTHTTDENLDEKTHVIVPRLTNAATTGSISFKFMILEGDYTDVDITADNWDDYAYQGSTQTLTLTEPLRGVPTTLTAYANYTDSDGQMWISDYIDVEEGLRYYRCVGGEVTEAIGVYSDFNDYLVFTLSTIGNANHIDTINNYFENQNNINIVYPTAEGIKSVSGALFCSILKSRLESEDIEGFNTWLADNPISYVGSYNAENQIPSPVAIDTTSLKKLRSYAGQTNLFVSDNAGLKADFRMDLGDKVIKGYILDYIESTGTQWIDTRIVLPSDDSFAINGVWQASPNPTEYIYGADNGSYSSHNFSFAKTYKPSDNDYHFMFYNRTNSIDGTPYDFTSNKIITKQTRTYISLDNVIKSYTNTIFARPSRSIFLFATDRGGIASYMSNVKSYQYNIELFEGRYLLNYLPIKRCSDNTICMYDTVTQSYFENQGTGDFLGGEIIGYITEDNIAYNNDGTLYNPDITTAVMSMGVEPAETQTLQLAQLEELGVTI